MTRRNSIALALSTLAIGLAVGSYAQSRNKLTADDYTEIQQLYARYNDAIDSGDAEGYAATFVSDGTFNTFTGHDALVGFINQWRGQMGGKNRRHWNTNLTITPSPEGADGTVYLFLMDVSQRPPVIATAAMYKDELVKTPQGWRFKKRQTKTDSTAPAIVAK